MGERKGKKGERREEEAKVRNPLEDSMEDKQL